VSIYVPLSRETKERLVELARQERRHPRDQAAILLERALGQTIIDVTPREAPRRELVPA
jgi:hypothetical protein